MDGMHLRATFLAVLLTAPLSAALAAPSAARPEIEALLARLHASSCSFQRNGSWHDAKEAQAHLLRKLAWLEDRNAVQSTEQFISLAASTSSSSGKPYLVRCGGTAPVESRRWLATELEALRAGRAPAPGR